MVCSLIEESMEYDCCRLARSGVCRYLANWDNVLEDEVVEPWQILLSSIFEKGFGEF